MKITISKLTHLRGIPTGWGNGYVLIPAGHPLHGKDYDDINEYVEVHGGLTFSKLVDEELIERSENDEPKLDNNDIGKWMVGFDTAHWNDTIQNWPKERVQRETESLKQQLMNYKP